MTILNRDAPAPTDQLPSPARVDDDWIRDLSLAGHEHDDAVRRLHELMLKAARHQVAQMHGAMPAVGQVRIDELVNQAANDATIAALGKLSSFEGRSRFTTWAYKFGILHAAVAVRRNMWRHRDVTLDQLPEPRAKGASPEQLAEAADLSTAVSGAITTVLTAHQRRVVVALLVEDVPIDVLADRLGSTRNALYKTLYDARVRLREDLTARGYVTVKTSVEVSS